MRKDLAILILSCDRYSELWKPFFLNFRLKWAECSYPIYLLANHKTFDADKVRTINVGDDADWSSNLIRAIDYIEEDYILTIFDDLFIKNDINDKEFDEIFCDFKKYAMNYLSLSPDTRTQWNFGGKPYYLIPAGDFYRSSAVFTLWKKEVLCALLEKGENAWQFEFYGTDRTKQYNNWFALNKKFFYYDNLLIKGKAMPTLYRALQSTLGEITLSFPVASKIEEHRLNIKESLFGCFWFLIPPVMRQYLQKITHRY